MAGSGGEDSAKAPPKTKPSPYRKLLIPLRQGEPPREFLPTRIPDELLKTKTTLYPEEYFLAAGQSKEDAKRNAETFRLAAELKKNLIKDWQKMLAPSVGEYNRRDQLKFERDEDAVALGKQKIREEEQKILKEFKPGPRGLKIPGTIDIHNRPVVKNEDGTISTVKSISIGTDKGEVLIPTISDEGKTLTPLEAVHLYKETGAHLGIFETPEDATAYAQSLHEQQAKEYGDEEDVEEGLKNQLITPGGLRFPKMIKGGELSPKGNK